jgi:uncharacterized coiled-coil protein SlyX
LLLVLTGIGTAGLCQATQAADLTDTFYGIGAGQSTTSGINDSAFGYNALYSNTTGYENTASGAYGLYFNTSGDYNTAGGYEALLSNTAGNNKMDNASEAIFSLHPVTFRYKRELDPASIPQFSLVAEEVEKVNRDLVARNDEGKPYSVRYDAVNAMLLNEFLKEHRKVEKLEATAMEQQEAIRALTESLKEQGSQIQKVSAQLEVSKTTSKVVFTDP